MHPYCGFIEERGLVYSIVKVDRQVDLLRSGAGGREERQRPVEKHMTFDPVFLHVFVCRFGSVEVLMDPPPSRAWAYTRGGGRVLLVSYLVFPRLMKREILFSNPGARGGP